MTHQAIKGIRFEVPATGHKKYIAIFPDGKRVAFGDRRYEHYRDQVPRDLGGQRWKHLDHEDEQRRWSYRRRHSAIKDKSGVPYHEKRYSPSWFSWYFLW